MNQIQKGDKVIDRYGKTHTVVDVYAPYQDAVPSVKVNGGDWIHGSNVTKVG